MTTNLKLKKCYVLLEKLPIKEIGKQGPSKVPRKTRNGSGSSSTNLTKPCNNSKGKPSKLPRENGNENINSSKNSNKRTYRPNSNVKSKTVKKLKTKKCNISNAEKFEILYNKRISALTRTHRSGTFSILKSHSPSNTERINIENIHELKKLNKSETKASVTEKNNIQTNLRRKRKTKIDHYEKQSQQPDSTRNTFVKKRIVEVKKNNKNNVNLCKKEKNQREDQYFQRDQECIENCQPKVGIKANNTSHSTDKYLKRGKTKDLIPNEVFEESWKNKENNNIEKVIHFVTEVDNLNKLIQNESTKNEPVKNETDVEKKRYHKFNPEKDKTIEIEMVKQDKELTLVNKSKKDEENLKKQTKLVNSQTLKSIYRITNILNRSKRINNDKNYMSLNFFHTSSKNLCKLSHNTILSEIHCIYMSYFNSDIEPMIDILGSALSSSTQVLSCWIHKKGETPSQEVDFSLKDYSRHFVQTFNSIQCKFLEVHRSLMITILYLHLLKNAAKKAVIKPGLMKTVVARLFRIENYKNIYDSISNSSHKKAKKTLNLFKKLLGKTLVDTFSKCDGKKCSDSFLNCNDKIDNTVVYEDEPQHLIDAFKNFQSVDFHPTLNEDNNLDLSINEEIERILDFHSSHHTEHKYEGKTFHTDCLEGITGDDCFNIACNKRKIVPCLFCYELVCCADFCGVQEDQRVYIASNSCDFITCVTCTQHKSISWSEEMFKVWNEAKDHPMLYNPVCWNVTCENRATVVCLCKAKAYCSLDCQVEDWENSHCDNCMRKPNPDLLCGPSENYSLSSGLEDWFHRISTTKR